MATQKEVLLGVFLDVDEYLQNYRNEDMSAREEKAYNIVHSLIRSRINTLNKQIEEYQGKLKRNGKQASSNT